MSNGIYVNSCPQFYNRTVSKFNAATGKTNCITYAIDQIVKSPHQSSDEIFEWCDIHCVKVDLLWSGYSDGIRSIWGIKDDSSRILFLMRWV